MVNKDFPKIVCLCGSVRYWDEFTFWRKRLSIGGHIVVGPEFQIPKEQADNPSSQTYQVKKNLDKLHLRKIDISDVVLVLNKDGYIGDSTKNEIKYAESIGKTIKYLED